MQVDVKNNDGETSFSLAKHANAVELMEILLAKGASCGTECSNLLREAIERKQDGLAAQVCITHRCMLSTVHDPNTHISVPLAWDT